MDKKLIIKIVVIVISFGGSAVILYNGFKGPKVPDINNLPGGISRPGVLQGEPGVAPVAGSGGIMQILPQGTTLNFEQAILPRFKYKTIIYPKLDPKEVGIPPSSLVVPLN